MSDDHSSPQSKSSSNPITRGLKRWLSTAPETRDELVKILHDSRQLLEPDTVDMLEGVLDLPATKIHEIMTPISQVVAIYDDQSLDDIMTRCAKHGLKMEVMDTSFFLNRETVIPSNLPGMALWREKLFALMMRNSVRVTDHFKIPANRVVEMGTQIEI